MATAEEGVDPAVSSCGMQKRIKACFPGRVWETLSGEPVYRGRGWLLITQQIGL